MTRWWRSLPGVSTILSGKYAFQVGVVAPRASGAEADVELRFHKAATRPSPASRGGRGRTHRAQARETEQGRAPGRESLRRRSAGKQGNFTVTVTRTGGRQVFRQSFPYTVSGWTPRRPVKPANAPPVEELALTAQYGPETNTVLVKADILDLPGREKSGCRGGEGDRSRDRQGARRACPCARSASGTAGPNCRLENVAIPVQDFRAVAPA